MATLNRHGLEPQEEAIMDLWDEGLSREDIAERLSITPALVRSVTSVLSEGRSDRWHLHARAATERLGMALAKAMAA
jgi:hypothetical protein